MKNNLAALVLIGAMTSTDATKLSLSSYLEKKSSVSKKSHAHSHAKGKDWDDMLENTSVFGESSYTTDSPNGYAGAVAEVVKEKEDNELAKIKDKEDSEKASVKAKEDAEKSGVKAKQDAENAKKVAIVEAEEHKKAEA
jgi:hypothetical protein